MVRYCGRKWESSKKSSDEMRLNDQDGFKEEGMGVSFRCRGIFMRYEMRGMSNRGKSLYMRTDLTQASFSIVTMSIISTSTVALTDRFEVIKEIGDGSFGSVVLAKTRSAGSSVARRGTLVSNSFLETWVAPLAAGQGC